MKKILAASLALVLGSLSSAAFGQASVDVAANADTTIYSEAADNSGGAGTSLWAGTTGTGAGRRLLITFAVGTGSIPAGSTISSATMFLYMTKIPSPTPGFSTLSVRRISVSWGEGVETGSGGGGVLGVFPSATWNRRFATSTFWSAAGGDFSGSDSGGWTEDATIGEYKAFTGGGMASDVQGWLGTPATNNGWLVFDASGTTSSARMFDSRNGTNAPILRIGYFKPLGAACGGAGECASGHCPNGFCCGVPSCPPQTECYFAQSTCGSSGVCSNTAYGTGQPCTSDGNPCTVDHCNGAGSCINTPGNAGTACFADTNPCTLDQCDGVSATCAHPAGNAGAACTPDDGDPCTAEQCNGVSTACQHPAGNNGATCNDGNFCTQTDTCSGGGCVGSNPKACPALDECHTVGICNPANGVCSTPAKTDGTPCTDEGNPCTVDQCTGGVCSHVAGNAGAACLDDGNPCSSDRCNGVSTVCQHLAGNPGAACGPAASCSCPGGICSATPASACDGSSTTCPVQSPVSCAGALCAGPICAGGCLDDTGCSSNSFCLGGKCTPKRADGDPQGCLANDYCINNACVDGYCCNSTCPGGSTDCQACNVAGKLGICSPILAGTACRASAGPCDVADTCNGVSTTCTDGKQPNLTGCPDEGNVCTNDQCDGVQNACQHPAKSNGTLCTDDANPCTTDTCQAGTCSHVAGNAGASCRAVAGVCDVPESCTGSSASCPTDGFAAPSLSCRTGTCTNGIQTTAANCTGVGPACPALATKNCAPYVCGATTCLTTCNADSQCAVGNWCNAGACQAKLPNGQACTVQTSCVSGLCVDGLCCNAACGGQCEACNAVGKLGTCSPVTGAPHGARTACASDLSVCGGACDGTVRTACAYPTGTTSCRAATCANGTATVGAGCDGAGKCPGVQTVACGQYVCGTTACLGNCNGDVDCVPGDYCAAHVCSPRLPAGGTCGTDNQCQTGHCVDGVCCNQACGEQCQACDIPGKLGTCSPANGPPHGKRAPCADNKTGCGGGCDGKLVTACSYPGQGVECRAGTCSSDNATLAASCDGTGACPPEQRQACKPFHCDANGVQCAGDCTVDSDCGLQHFCAGGVCAPSLPNGAACADGNQCASSYCVDGLCCTTPCTGQCEACNEPGDEGTCRPIAGAPHGIRLPCKTDSTSCGGSCDGTQSSCTYPGTTTQCRTAACANDIATLQAFCQGTGECPDIQLQACRPNVCAGTRCGGGCTTDANCAANQFCSGGVCIAKLGMSEVCGSNTQCANGQCVDGFCCDKPCTGECEACDVIPFVGKCTVVPAGGEPRGGRVPCPGVSACAAQCDGKSTLVCAYPGGTSPCGLGVCKGGVQRDPSVCNGAGSCLPATGQSCEGYACGDPTSGPAKCLTSCTTPSDCLTGYECQSGQCVPVIPVDAGPDAAVTTDAAAGGAAGAGAQGGAQGSGGSPGKTDGGIATGGTGPTDGGRTKPDASATARATDKGACGCRIGASGTTLHGGALSALGVAVMLLRRRRRARGPSVSAP